MRLVDLTNLHVCTIIHSLAKPSVCIELLSRLAKAGPEQPPNGSYLENEKNKRSSLEKVARHDLSQDSQAVTVKVCYSIYCSDRDHIDRGQS